MRAQRGTEPNAAADVSGALSIVADPILGNSGRVSSRYQNVVDSHAFLEKLCVPVDVVTDDAQALEGEGA